MGLSRRRIKHTRSLEERLAEAANILRDEAKKRPPGEGQENLLEKARQAETGSLITEWLRSPGLKPPD